MAAPWVIGVALGLVQWTQSPSSFSTALVQGNIDQTIKWQRDQVMPNLEQHLRLSEPHWDVDVLVWPEAAMTFFPQQGEPILEDLAQQSIKSDTAFIFGIPGAEPLQDGYDFKNLAMGLGLAKGRFAKHHLVPFGEYVPLEGVLRGLIDFFDLPMSASTPGDRRQPNIATQVGQIAMAICYEVAYPATMREKATQAAVLATISNDTWFGQSVGPLQHMQIAQVRAAENGRWLLRATNNGVTAIVDHKGRQVAKLPQFEEGVLRGEVEVRVGRTPYNLLGNWILFVALIGCLLPGVVVSLRPQNQ